MKEVLNHNEEGFRVSVCLRRFFDDERAQCYMWVFGSRTVRSLRRRLRRLFPLPRRLALRCRGHLLPPSEPLSLLRPDDAVEVMQLPETWDWAYTKNNIDACEEVIHNQSIDNESQADNYENSKINRMDTEHPSNDDVIDGHSKVAIKDMALTQLKEEALALLQNYEVKSQTTDMFPKGVTKRVRRRVRRRKPRLIPCTVNDDGLESSAISEQGQQQAFDLSPPETPTKTADPPDLPLLISTSLPLVPNLYRDVVSTAPNVLRNDAAIPRKARIVRPLDSEIHSMPQDMTCHDLQVNE